MKSVLDRLKNGVRDESGQTLVLAALCMVVLLSFVGLALDGGQLYYTKRRLQAAADAAALAGALEISSCGSVSNCSVMQTAAQSALVENGLAGSTLLTQCATRTSTALTLTLNNAPCALGSKTQDPNYGSTDYVEAVISKSQPTYFMKLLGINSVEVAARAEAGIGSSTTCVYITNSSANDALELNGRVTLKSACGVAVASSATSALLVNSGSSISASFVDVHGGVSNQGTISPSPVTNAAVVADPLSWVPTPSIGSCLKTNYSNSGSAATTLSPGTYCGPMNLNSSGITTFNPGVYVFTAGLNVNGPISGTGVTFYFSSGSILINGSNTVNLVAPTTGTYAGILIYQASTDTSQAIINGSSSNVFQGALYLPGAELLVNGGSNTAAYTIIDANEVLLNGSVTFTIEDDYSSLPGGSPAKGGGSAILSE